MKICLIIGAGQLGSRHLQGLLRLNQKQTIYLLDPSKDALEISKSRAAEIPNNHKINYVTDWHNLPNNLDLVIIATSANVRANVTKQLLEGYKVKNLILEKILFQDLESYNVIKTLINETKTPTWVNHPRRMLDHYQQIKKIIEQTNEKVTFQAFGSDWGLACNALHFVDLFVFLSGSKIKELDMDWIDGILHESKRDNFIEFTGSLKGLMDNNSNFFINSFEGKIGEITLYVSSISNRWIILEGSAQKIIHLAKENNFDPEIMTFVTEYQSTLTSRIADDIFKLGQCNLPTYEEACESHIPFITASLSKYIEITKKQTNICPIT